MLLVVSSAVEKESSVWDPHCNGLIGELENAQKRAARFETKIYIAMKLVV